MGSEPMASSADLARELGSTRAALEQAQMEVENHRSLIATLEEALHARDAVLSVVAHDLRNPLNIINLAANTLLQRLPDPTARRPVERIVRSARRADRMIADLLQVNAIETGKFFIEHKPVETASLVLAAIDSQQSLAAGASLILNADLSPDLPAFRGDEERMHEVLENLIGNAIKFTAAGGTITIGACRKDAELLFWVKDTGAGIPAEQLPFVFDRFWQAKQRARGGIGLGLSICKSIVEAHGGRIWVESTVGTGTTLFFALPASPTTPVPALCPLANILLVDDRPENLLSLRAILERPDYRLVTASSGEQALALALREHFALALIDIAMPGMNGIDVATHLKELERTRSLPIIFVTAFGNDPDEVHRAYAAGGADYLVKPLDADIVRKKVAVFVGLSRRLARHPEPEP